MHIHKVEHNEYGKQKLNTSLVLAEFQTCLCNMQEQPDWLVAKSVILFV